MTDEPQPAFGAGRELEYPGGTHADNMSAVNMFLNVTGIFHAVKLHGQVNRSVSEVK